MRVYKCILCEDEFFTDTVPIEINGEVIKVTGKMATRKEGGIDDKLIGGNASAEEPVDPVMEEGSQTGINVVLDNRLKETGFGTKKDYMVYFKGYMQKLLEKHKEMTPDLDEDDFKKRNQDCFKEIMKSYKDYQFFTGESEDPEATIALLKWEGDGGEIPCFYFFKDSMKCEKL